MIHAPVNEAPLRLDPRCRPLIDVAPDDWRRIEAELERQLTPDGGRRHLSQSLHALLFWRPKLACGAGIAAGPDWVQSLFVSPSPDGFYDGEVLIRTRHGLRYRWLSQLYAGAGTGESHLDQALAVFAIVGVPPDTPVIVSGEGQTFAAVLAESIASFNMQSRELEFTAIGLTHYLPPARKWTDKFGRPHTFDDLAAELLRLSLDGTGSCAGTHRLQALVFLLRAGRARGILRAAALDEVEARVREMAATIRATQRPSGAWDADWWRTGHPSESARQELLVTSHLVELMLCLPDDFDVDDEVLERAGHWLLATLVEGAETGDLKPCPLTHAACAVRLLKR